MIQARNLEADVVDVCNMRCVDCSHMAPNFKQSTYSFEEFEKDIETLSKVLRVFQFTIIGGEPLLLGANLSQYVRVIRKTNLAEYVRLITNGTLLHRWPTVINEFDTIAVSIYPSEKSKKVEEWVAENPTPKIVMWKVNEFGEFYTPELLSDAEAQASWDQCFPKTHCHSIYKGKYYRCIGAAKYPHPSEGVDLYAPELEPRLKAYIENTQRLPSCSHCYGGRKKHVWTESLSSSRDIYNHEQSSP